jgi:hypothetical protein
MDAASLADFLGAKLSAGAHPNTMRKYLARLRARYRHEHLMPGSEDEAASLLDAYLCRSRGEAVAARPADEAI